MKEKRNKLHIPELNDSDVEKLAKDVPALSKGAVERITESCINKMEAADTGFAAGTEVSGTERYSRPKLTRWITAAAACLAFVAGAAGIVYINRSMDKNPLDLEVTDAIVTDEKIAPESGNSDSAADDENKKTSDSAEIVTENSTEASSEANTAAATTGSSQQTATEPVEHIITMPVVTEPTVTAVCSHPLTTVTTAPKTTTVSITVTTERQEEPPTVNVQEKFEKLCADTRGLWANIYSNDELEYISLDGSGSYILYDFERIKLTEGKLEFVTCDCANADHISLLLKLYDGEYYLEYDGTNLVSDDERLNFSRKSYNPDSALPYPQNRMKGIWLRTSGDGPAIIACGLAEGYIAYDDNINVVNKGWMCWTEIAMEDPFAVDTANIYSLDGTNLSFRFTERNVVRSLNGEEYRRIGYDPENLDILRNG